MGKTIPVGILQVNTCRSVTFRDWLGHNLPMDSDARRKANSAHRLARLTELRDAFCGGSAAAFSRRIGIAETYGVRMFWGLDKPGRKGLGPDLESRIRAAFALPVGWFDMPLGVAIPSRQSANETAATDQYYANMDEESRLLRAFRLAPPPIRRNLLRQADGILEDLENPSLLNGTDKPTPG